MKRFLRSATIVAVLSTVAATTSLVMAQGTPAAPSGGAVAVIDIAVIFKKHPRFTQMMEDMKKDVEAAENSLKAERDKINGMIGQLQGFKPSSNEYKTLEEQITAGQAGLKVRMQQEKREFFEREAQIYFSVYNEVNKFIAYFAQRHNISLVLRHDSSEVKADNRQSVLQYVNRAVVYQSRIDITDDVLAMLHAQYPQQPVNQNPVPGGVSNRPQIPVRRPN